MSEPFLYFDRFDSVDVWVKSLEGLRLWVKHGESSRALMLQNHSGSGDQLRGHAADAVLATGREGLGAMLQHRNPVFCWAPVAPYVER